MARAATSLIPLIVACSLFMEQLDSTIIATALPTIARDIDVDPLRLNLAITCYLLSLSIFIPLSGWMADRFGARTVFRAAIGVFMIGSIACGLSNGLWEFVIARMVQGMGGAMMSPVGRFVMLRSVPKADLMRAMIVVTTPAMLGPVFGPPLGGFIVTYFSWRWIFFINVPIALLGILLVTLFVDNLREDNIRPIDWSGFFLTGIGLSCLVFGFEIVGRGGLPVSVVLTMIVVGIICILTYIWHAKRTAFPVIDLRLLEIPTFRIGVTGGTLTRMGIGSLPFLLPLMLQLGFGYTPIMSGLLTFASAAGAMSNRVAATYIIRRFGYRNTLLFNAFLTSALLGINAIWRPGTPVAVIFVVLLFGGFFRSLQFSAVNTLGYSDVPASQMSRATPFASMAQQLAASLGIGTGALFVHLTLILRGHTVLGPSDFTPAFIGVGLVSFLAVPIFMKLAPDAGAGMIGGRRHAEEADRPGSTGGA
ncbi:MAG TPA: MFS transporter [Stellaceae bacterium]|jgi:EmrB/QacA subfamily drug resistance transporter|nr:MFS transporter [Stellaceae bacterium]